MSLNGFSQENATGEKFNFSLLRQNDEILMDSSCKKNLYKNLKYIPIGRKASLSLGGSYRFQTEGFVNEEFNSEEDQNDFWFLHRGMLHAHLRIKDKFEFFGELSSAQIHGKDNLAPVDRDQLSFNQLFARYYFNTNWNVLVGRQNMRMGSGRLVDVREGPNVRLSFDMAQLEYADKNTNIKVFHAVPVRQDEGVFDNNALEYEEHLTGGYWTQNWSKKLNTDFYVLYKEEDNKRWQSGVADDRRLSLGLRHFGKWKNLRYNNEFVYQTGKFGNQNISAWTASFNLEKDVNILNKNYTLGLKTEIISGDDSNETKLNTFDGLYPRGAYFGRVARFGPSNLIDIHPYIDFSLGPVSVELDYVAFWRFSIDDGVYGPPLNLQYEDLNNSRLIGQQIGSIFGYEVSSFLALELEGNVIFPGAFLNENGLEDTLLHGVFTMAFKF